MTIRGGLWKAVREANPDLTDEDVDAAVDRAVTQERDLVLKRGLNFDQARELAREELFPDHDPRDSARPAADREAATAQSPLTADARATIEAENAELIARLKRRLADCGNAGVPDDVFLAGWDGIRLKPPTT